MVFEQCSVDSERRQDKKLHTEKCSKWNRVIKCKLETIKAMWWHSNHFIISSNNDECVLWNALALPFQDGLYKFKRFTFFSFVLSISAHIRCDFPLKLFCKRSEWIPNKQIKYLAQVKIIQLTWIHVSTNLNSFKITAKIIMQAYKFEKLKRINVKNYYVFNRGISIGCKSVFTSHFSQREWILYEYTKKVNVNVYGCTV